MRLNIFGDSITRDKRRDRSIKKRRPSANISICSRVSSYARCVEYGSHHCGACGGVLRELGERVVPEHGGRAQRLPGKQLYPGGVRGQRPRMLPQALRWHVVRRRCRRPPASPQARPPVPAASVTRRRLPGQERHLPAAPLRGKGIHLLPDALQRPFLPALMRTSPLSGSRSAFMAPPDSCDCTITATNLQLERRVPWASRYADPAT